MNLYLKQKEIEKKQIKQKEIEKIREIRDNLYNNLLKKDKEVKFANYLDFNEKLNEYSNNKKLTELCENIKTDNSLLIEKNEELKNILQFLLKEPESLKEAKQCLEHFKKINIDKSNFNNLEEW